MLRRGVLALCACCAIVTPATTVASPIPDLDCCDVITAAPVPVSICVAPDGSGPPLTAARALDHAAPLDATITVFVRDGQCIPIQMFPHEDIWLETTGGGVVICPAGSIADHPTGPDGSTTFTAPLRAGRHSDDGEQAVVVVTGTPLGRHAVAVRFNSPDISGNLVVNLQDTVLFATDMLGGSYVYRSDFHYDGLLNLSDTVLFALGMGAECP